MNFGVSFQICHDFLSPLIQKRGLSDKIFPLYAAFAELFERVTDAFAPDRAALKAFAKENGIGKIIAFTADGAGWGHGRQCLIWGYPIHGTNGSLNILSKLAGTPWGASLDANAIETIFDFLRGSAFYFYKGTIPPVLERGNARPDYAKKRETRVFETSRFRSQRTGVRSTHYCTEFAKANN